jgi:hypothetical protein
MKSIPPAIVIMAALALSACATPEQRAERTIANFGPYCDKLGFDRASDGWRTCVMQSAAQAESARSARMSAFGAMQSGQAAMNQANRPRTCTHLGCN